MTRPKINPNGSAHYANAGSKATHRSPPNESATARCATSRDRRCLDRRQAVGQGTPFAAIESIILCGAINASIKVFPARLARPIWRGWWAQLATKLRSCDRRRCGPCSSRVAPTLAYDHIALLGEAASVPSERAAHVTVPALVMDGELSYPFMHVTATAHANTMPRAKHHTLKGQTHEAAPEALAPVLVEFFTRETGAS